MLKKNMTILFQGDSVTDCGRDRENPYHLGAGYPALVAAALSFEHPKKELVFVNRGVSANRTTDLYARWKEDALNLQPDIISVLIGVNDVWHSFSRNAGVAAERYEQLLTMLIEDTAEALPETRLMFCEPFVLPLGDVQENTALWYAEMEKRQTIVKTLCADFGHIFIPLQTPFQKAAEESAAGHWLPDGVHPSPAGHQLIAENWLKGFEKLKKNKKNSKKSG